MRVVAKQATDIEILHTMSSYVIIYVFVGLMHDPLVHPDTTHGIIM